MKKIFTSELIPNSQQPFSHLRENQHKNIFYAQQIIIIIILFAFNTTILYPQSNMIIISWYKVS